MSELDDPVNLLLFLIDPRKPRPGAVASEGPGPASGEPGAPPQPAQAEPGGGLAKASAFIGISGLMCWGFCGPVADGRSLPAAPGMPRPVTRATIPVFSEAGWS